MTETQATELNNNERKSGDCHWNAYTTDKEEVEVELKENGRKDD